MKNLLLVYTKAGYNIILVSGRSDEYRELTENWLRENNIFYIALWMRKADDIRADSIIKEEIFKEYIEPYYTVHAIIDDRKRVLRMWRRLGLPTFAVGNQDVEF